MPTYTISGAATATPEETAAALAVIAAVLEAEQIPPLNGVNGHPGWRDAARLVTQGLTPSRLPVAARWSTIERLHRAGRGGSGVTGL